MKADIHPQYNVTTVTCGCGNTFTTRSTAPSGTIHVEVCSNCHPFYTGKQKILDTGGRVARFEKRFGKNPSTKPSGKKERKGLTRGRPPPGQAFAFSRKHERKDRCSTG
jgi:large subunit ribosomal protein L31